MGPLTGISMEKPRGGMSKFLGEVKHEPTFRLTPCGSPSGGDLENEVSDLDPGGAGRAAYLKGSKPGTSGL
jgi:hypothetical protein